ncbi:MAG: alpha/beta hydrolase [Propionibacteriaceae bacterium]
MNRRTRVVVALARRMPHPEPPTDRYLARLRMDPPAPALSRRLLGPVPRGVRITDRSLPLESGSRPVRIYAPAVAAGSGPLPLVVNFHGGGFVFGNLSQTDWLCGQLAGRIGAVVVSVSYRLAPEFPAPVPFQDCRDATAWLIDHADELDADPRRVTVMGASAGGNLAALVALHHRDRCRQEPDLAPLAHQVLIYPATDLTLSSPSVVELSEAPILTRAIMDWFGRRYLPQGQDDSLAGDDPWVSPLFARDHSELAPALIVAAGQDPLRDDATRYGVALEAAGVPTRVVTYPEAIHGFISMPRIATEASLALAEIVSTLTEHASVRRAS